MNVSILKKVDRKLKTGNPITCKSFEVSKRKPIKNKVVGAEPEPEAGSYVPKNLVPLCREIFWPLDLKNKIEKSHNPTTEKSIGTEVFGTKEIGPRRTSPFLGSETKRIT